MRLIDATKLEADIINLCLDGKMHWKIMDVIFSQPTIEPERPHGEWEKKSLYSEYFYCSECKYAYKHAFNFCPNCGADMREGEAREE